MKKIISFLKVMASRADYLLHHLAAEDIVLLCFAILVHFLPWAGAMGIANIVAVIVLIGKEVYDYFHPDKEAAEVMDIFSGLTAIALADVFITLTFLFL